MSAVGCLQDGGTEMHMHHAVAAEFVKLFFIDAVIPLCHEAFGVQHDIVAEAVDLRKHVVPARALHVFGPEVRVEEGRFDQCQPRAELRDALKVELGVLHVLLEFLKRDPRVGHGVARDAIACGCCCSAGRR